MSEAQPSFAYYAPPTAPTSSYAQPYDPSYYAKQDNQPLLHLDPSIPYYEANFSYDPNGLASDVASPSVVDPPTETQRSVKILLIVLPVIMIAFLCTGILLYIFLNRRVPLIFLLNTLAYLICVPVTILQIMGAYLGGTVLTYCAWAAPLISVIQIVVPFVAFFKHDFFSSIMFIFIAPLEMIWAIIALMVWAQRPFRCGGGFGCL